MWFDLDLFGTRKKRLRELDTAILLAGRLLDSLNSQPAGAGHPVPTAGPPAGADHPVPTAGQPAGADHPVPAAGPAAGADRPVPTAGQPAGADHPVLTAGPAAGADRPVPTAGQPAGAYHPVSATGPAGFMTAVQIKSLLDFAGDDLRDALRREGSPFKAAFDIAPQWADTRALADALKALQSLLQGRRNVLLPQKPADQGQQAAAAAQRGNVEAATGGTNPTGPVRPDEASVLWAVTDRLYASWHIRGIILLVASAIAIAAGGSFVIGSQTLNIRKSLDDAQERAQTEIRAISAATQTRVSDESKDVITRLHERGTDIDVQLKRAEAGVADLKAGSDAIKKEIIAKLSEDLKAQETSLKDEIVKPLIQARDEDLKNINGNLDAVRKSVAEVSTSADEQKAKLDALSPKLAQLGIFAGQSNEIGTAFSRITTDGEAAHTSRLNAESEAQSATLQRKAAETSAAEAEKLRSQTSDAVKTASDEALKHIGTLGGIAEQLKALDGKLKDLDGKLSGEVAAEEARLKPLRDRITILENEAHIHPLVPLEPAKLKTVDDLTRDEKKQVQQRLAEEGVDVGPIDGKFGKQTATAVRAYQTKMKQEVSGQLSPEQIGELLKPK